ncbi:MAG: ATP-binding protein [Chloroflexi bacterium]|nr:ATP-binding protein [Chloroflexota bacterium]
MTEHTRLIFSLHPNLLSRQLGSDMYRAPDALKQLVANALDAESSRVDVKIAFNDLDAPMQVVVSDDGCGIAPEEMAQAFGAVGTHVARPTASRETIGSRGIGRFAVFSLAAEARWETISDADGVRTKQSWVMVPGRQEIEIEAEEVGNEATGTVISLTLSQRQDVLRLFSGVTMVKRVLFNSFAGYLARYDAEVGIWVNNEKVSLDEFVDERETEEIEAHDEVPGARLTHMVLSQQVEQMFPSILVFATHGTTVSQEPLAEESIPGRKYLGLVDSGYLSELTNTSKSELAEFDPGFLALREETSKRAKQFIVERQSGRAREFLERARLQNFYPYKEPPTTPVDGYRRQLYDNILLTMEETYKIGNASLSQQKLIFGLTQQLMHSEDLSSVLTNVLGLTGEEVARFAALLRRTSLNSIIAVADLLVDRIRFLDEMQVLVYGQRSEWVKERSQLHKILERHTWLFGERFHLMGSDRRLYGLLPEVAAALTDGQDDEESRIDVDGSLRDIPDLYLARTNWNEGARFHEHLIVELKRPSVRITEEHVGQLKRYSAEIVGSPVWGQKKESHRFTFVLVSSDVSKNVRDSYQVGEEPGFLSRPQLDHPTELWALRWSDYLDRRREELNYLQDEMEITADPELLEYLKERVGEFLPEEITKPTKPVS